MMSEQHFSVLSLTYAYKAKNVLEKNRIATKIVNVPRPGKADCGYALVVENNRELALQLLIRHGITVTNA